MKIRESKNPKPQNGLPCEARNAITRHADPASPKASQGLGSYEAPKGRSTGSAGAKDGRAEVRGGKYLTEDDLTERRALLALRARVNSKGEITESELDRAVKTRRPKKYSNVFRVSCRSSGKRFK